MRLLLRLLQIPSLHPTMLIAARDVALPLSEVPSIVEATQIQVYLGVIPASIIVYDTRAFLLQTMCVSSLMLCQSVRWTRKYAVKRPLYDSMMSMPD